MAQLDAGLSACFQLQRMRSFAKFVLLLVLCSSLSFASSTDAGNTPFYGGLCLVASRV